MDCPMLLIAGGKDVRRDPRGVPAIQEVTSAPLEIHVVPDLTHVLRLDFGINILDCRAAHFRIEDSTCATLAKNRASERRKVLDSGALPPNKPSAIRCGEPD